MNELNKIYNEDCLEGMKRIPDKSVDAIVTDPPYKYLKHKLDRDWNEDAVFAEWNRVLKDDGFIVIFGRGIPFYRWNVKLNELGFSFKEEIIWNKNRSSSPFNKIGRVHETIALLTKKGVLNKIRVPYIEKQSHNFEKVKNDLSRISGALEDAEFVQSLKKYIENNELEFKKSEAKFNIVEKKKSLDRRIDIIRAMKEGSVLTDVVSVSRDHYQNKTSHDTQKPVHLMEMLVKLVSGENSLILDPFSGSGSTALACQNLNRKFIAFEIDKEYYEKSLERIKNNVTQLDLFDEVSE